MDKRHFTKIFTLILLVSVVYWGLPVSAHTAFAGIDIGGMDKSVDPGDDFWAYANGGWAKATTIPADRTSFGAFDVIFDEVSKRTNDLITTAAASKDPEIRKVGD